MEDTDIRYTYDSLWEKAVPAIRSNEVRADPHLLDRSADTRRGLTLICRPSAAVREAVGEFLAEARGLEPEQYVYQKDELHTTILAVITNTPGFRLEEVDVPAYIETVSRAVDGLPPFRIRYRGVTAAPDSVLIQGFPESGALEWLRERIREAFRADGLKSTLDARYKTHTAHLTCLRFQYPVLRNPEAFLRFLERNRETDFGTSTMDGLEFVWNDWYMSQGRVQVLETFRLQG